MKKKTTGLILGKFAPFHIGHCYLIDAALKEVGEVIIILYDCPDITHIPLNVRAGWVRKLYPQVEVIEGWDAPNRHEDTPEVKRMQEQYIKKVLNGKKITHFFSSEYYGEHMSEFLKAVNRVIDINRDKYHISATMIRKNTNLYKNFMHPMVVSDLTTKAVILGMPNISNERIARQVAKELSTSYAADDLLAYLGKHKRLPDFKKIAKNRIKKRSSKTLIYSAHKSLIYNSSALIDHIFSLAIHRKFDQELYLLAYNEISNYDLVFVSSNLSSTINKLFGISTELFMNQLLGNLLAMKIDFIKINGTQEEKVRKIKGAIKSSLRRKKH